MLDWIQRNIDLLTNKNKNVIISNDTLEKRNRRLEDTTTDYIRKNKRMDRTKRLIIGLVSSRY